MFDDDDMDMFAMDDDLAPPPPANTNMMFSNTSPAPFGDDDMGTGGMDMDMGMGGMMDDDDLMDFMSGPAPSLPDKPMNPNTGMADAPSSHQPVVIDLIDDDDDDPFGMGGGMGGGGYAQPAMTGGMNLPDLAPPPRPSAPGDMPSRPEAPEAAAAGGGAVMGAGLPDPYAPTSFGDLEFPDLSTPTVDYKAQAAIDPAEAMRQMTQSVGMGAGDMNMGMGMGMGGEDQFQNLGEGPMMSGAGPMPQQGGPVGGQAGGGGAPMGPQGGMMPQQGGGMAPAGNRNSMGPQMGMMAGNRNSMMAGSNLSGGMPFNRDMYAQSSGVSVAGDSMSDKIKYGLSKTAGGVEKTLEMLRLKEKDTAKHYVKAVLDKVRSDDPTLTEVNLSACRLNRSKLTSLVKSLRTNSQVKKLDFSNHGLAGADADVVYLTKHLQDSKTITWMDLRLNHLSLKGITAIESLLKINLNFTRVELFEPMYKGDQENVAKTLGTIQWLLQGNFNYHAFLAGQSVSLILSGRSYKQLVARLLEGAEKCRIFDVSHNELEELPDNIKLLVNVEDFQAKSNRITTIPKTIGNLRHMRKLVLSFNQLSILPDEFTKLESLEYLDMSHNSLYELPEMFRLLTKLQYVDLSFNQLKRLPEELSNLEELETLLLSQNQLTALPDSIVLLSKVKKIDVSANALKSLPDERPNLLYLVDLLLSNNQIMYLPEGIGMLPELRRLDCSNNKLTKLPDEITNLHRMEELILHDNQLTALPEFIGLMWRLTKIDLLNNKLTAIPESIQLLKYLRVLDLQHNRLKRLHEFFATVVSLDELKIMGNESIKGISQETIKLGDAEVIATVQQMPKGVDKTWRTKLIVVGQGSIGKSSIVDSLHAKLDRKYKKPKDEACTPTEGIRTLEMMLRTTDTTVALSVWDFSGADDFDLTQSLFLSPRGVYLVCFNMLDDTRADIKIEQTLQIITSKAPEAPVILVGTHADDKKVNQKYRKVFFQRIKEKFYRRFPSIKTHLAVSGKTGKGIEPLLERIQKYVSELPDIGKEIPKGFIYLEDRVKVLRTVMKRPLAPFDRFKDEIFACGIDQSQVLEAMKHLHNAGLIIFFPVTFRDYVFLDAQWVTDIFSSIPRMRKYVKKGFLPESDLEQVWDPMKFPADHHDLILSLLEGFELVLRPKELNKIFVPAYLEEEATPSPAKLNEMWPPGYEMEEPEFRRVYIFKFFPQGLFSRLIGRFVNNLGWELEHYWKGGAILMSPSYDRAFIKLDTLDKSLNITVRGESAGDELSNLIDNTNALVRDTMKLSVETFVPCTHCLLLEEGKRPYLFPIEEFENAISEGKEYVLCNGEVAVKLRALLPNMA